jgi:hypothetical protein
VEEVDERAATGEGLGGEPASEAGDAGAADPLGLRGIDLPHDAVVDVFHHRLGLRARAVVEVEEHLLAGLLGGDDDFSDDDDYIRNNCNNPNWENSMSIEPSEDKDSLEQLVLLKKDVGNNVKINFESLLDESEKLVKQFKITN